MATKEQNTTMIFYRTYMLSAQEAQLTLAQRAEFYEALMGYAFDQKIPEFDNVIMRCLFTAFKVNIDNTLKKLARHHAAVENGKRGAAKRYATNTCKSDDNLANDLAKNQNGASITNTKANNSSSTNTKTNNNNKTKTTSISMCGGQLNTQKGNGVVNNEVVNNEVVNNEVLNNEVLNNGVLNNEVLDKEECRLLYPVPKTIQERNIDFYKSLLPYIPKYGLDRVRRFYEYWVEPTQDRLFLRFEKEANWNLESRLNRWKD